MNVNSVEQTPASTSAGNGSLRPPRPFMLGASLFLAALYWFYSTFSEGFYQHDEASHFLNMLDFWRQPDLILSDWAKPGYKVLFVTPALLGHHVVLVLHCLLAALACYLAARLAERLGSPRPALSFLFLALQPLWLQLSFRSYSESLAAVVLLSALLMHYRRRPGIAALFFSYAILVRQEMIILAAVYAAWLLCKRRMASVLLLPVFPLLLHLAGSRHTGDPWYLWNSSSRYVLETARTYPRLGFSHYFVMAPAIFGHVVVALAVLYLLLVLLGYIRPAKMLVAAAGAYFLLHCLINLQAFPVGAATAGNLRYMNVIAPLVAIFGNLAVDGLLRMPARRPLIPFLAGYGFAIGLFCTYPHANWQYFLGQRDWIPLLFAVAMCAGIYYLQAERRLIVFLTAACLLLPLFAVRPIELSTEDRVVRDAAAWLRGEGTAGGSLLYSHALLRYFARAADGKIVEAWRALDAHSLAAVPPGTSVVWDSHYSYRANNPDGSVPLEALTGDPEHFTLLNSFRSSDGRFEMVVYRKR